MDLLTIIIGAALLVTITVAVMGIFSMLHGDKFDTQMKWARVGTDTLTFWLLVVALYLLIKSSS